jgi:hypothetical protein
MSLSNLLGLVTGHHSPTTGTLNNAAAAFTSFRPSTAFTFKRQLFLTSTHSFNKQLKQLLYISVLRPKPAQTVFPLKRSYVYQHTDATNQQLQHHPQT